MQALVKRDSGPGDVVVTTLPDPEPAAGEVVVDVAACGICGSDLHAIAEDPGFEWVRAPVVLGHELAGTVAAVGEGVDRFAAGDPVVPISIQGCLTCDECRAGATQLCAARRIIGLSYDGGVAERVAVPAAHLIPVPAGLQLDVAAATEPLSVAVRATLERIVITPGDRVVVSGPGPIGLFCALLAQRCGARVLVVGSQADLARRLPIAADAGIATATTDELDGPASLHRRLGGRPPDAWIEASGAGPALVAALAAVRRGGVISVVSLFGAPTEVFMTAAVRAELTICGSYASARPDYLRALELIASGALDPEPLLDRYALAEAEAAVRDARAGRAIKPLIVPGLSAEAAAAGRAA